MHSDLIPNVHPELRALIGCAGNELTTAAPA